MTLHVFIYGTLRRGEINDLEVLAMRLGLAHPRHLGRARTPGTLYDFGDWPGLVSDTDAPRILGDVYAVDDALLAAMDAVEEIQPGKNTLFVRDELVVEIDGCPLTCFFYPVDPAQLGAATPIAADDWVAYRQAR